MHRSRIVTLLYCFSGVAAAFLSWASQSLLGEVTYVKGIDPAYSITKANIGDGWLTLICFCIIIVLVVTGKRDQLMNLKKIWWTVVFALISLLISVYYAITIFKLSKASSDTLTMKVSPGVGLYLTILVSVFLIFLPFKHRLSKAST
jgi:hypothetical protein